MMPEYTSFKEIVQEDTTGTQFIKILLAGGSFYDAATGFGLKVLSIGTTAEVSITFGPPPPDVTPPTIRIVSPIEGQVLRGVVVGSVLLSEPATVEWYAIGSNWKVKIAEGVSPTQDTRLVTDGAYQIQAKATDPAGNFGWSQIVSIAIDNTTVIEPPPKPGKGKNR
jgi:hypothetical protein